MSEWTEARLEQLKEDFLKQGEIHPEPDHAKNELSHDGVLDEGHELPELLQNVLKVGAKWNFTKDSYDCFGCNILVVSPANTTDIFGDEDCRQEWLEEHGDESCAGKDWALVCITSEFDFCFVNIRADSEQFSATCHIVNNCLMKKFSPRHHFQPSWMLSRLMDEKDEDKEIESDDFGLYNKVSLEMIHNQ